MVIGSMYLRRQRMAITVQWVRHQLWNNLIEFSPYSLSCSTHRSFSRWRSSFTPCLIFRLSHREYRKISIRWCKRGKAWMQLNNVPLQITYPRGGASTGLSNRIPSWSNLFWSTVTTLGTKLAKKCPKCPRSSAPNDGSTFKIENFTLNLCQANWVSKTTFGRPRKTNF